MTLQGKPSANSGARKKLEAATGKVKSSKGTTVSIDMARQDVIMLRWDPPRKYDTIMHFLAKYLKHHIFQVASVDGTADVTEEDDKKEIKKEIKEEEQEEENIEDQKVAVSAASAASVGQQLSGRHLPLKLQALLQCRPSSEDSLPTPGLHVFEDLILGEGSFGRVCAAEYKGQKAAAKVFTFAERIEIKKTGKRRKIGESTNRLESARCEVTASAAFPADPNILRLLDVFVQHDAVLLVYPRFDASLRDMCKQRTFVELEVKLVMRSLLHACAHLHMHGLVHTDVKPQHVLVKGGGAQPMPKWLHQLLSELVGR